jgi:hypothetical protein
MRVHDWPQQLDAYIVECSSRAFDWTDFNCALFAADWVQRVTGVDPAAGLREISSKTDALRVLAQYSSLQDMASKQLGKDPVHSSAAMRGDVVLARIPIADGTQAECFGICCGNKFAFPQDLGLRFHSRSVVLHAWSID